MEIGSRLLSASDSDPGDASGREAPLLGQTLERGPLLDRGGGAAASALSSGPFLRFRKSKGTSLLSRAGILSDGLDHSRIRECGGIAEHPALGDVAQETAHDLARPRLRQVRHEQ